MKLAPLLDPLLGFLLRRRSRRRRAEGVLLVSSRGPAEMVFLSAVLARFMRLGRLDESVTLLCRADAAGMAFLFPRLLKLRRIDFERLDETGYRWKAFSDLHAQHYRLIVSLDYIRIHDRDEALIVAADPAETAGMMPPRLRRNFERRRDESEKVFDTLFESGPIRQDKIVRWSKFAGAVLGKHQPLELALLPDSLLPPAEQMSDTVVLFPFSGVRQRMLPAESWRRLAEAIPPHWRILVAGHRSDFDRHPAIMTQLNRSNVEIETGGFDRLASILMGARMAVGVDTAGLHLAVLLGTPTLCLASAAFVGAGVPYDERIVPDNVQFIYSPMPCQGCMDRCKFPLIDGMYPCVADIDIESAIAAIGDNVTRGAF
ncbi:glycosyltransferase family 9 protein [Magnetospirillum molischianum]|uniref:ADP-heptose:LPS heptosyltransferase n=1 Tax=Magnetospirillum molischianum DSM 120 TaxID=1150626 RepID=H8FU78_MAGML|nr:glycosyltransferase family 9 protein [Magnetospirillum molischianum]CCG41916.1 conserved hypothetical protein [Magnetospirillum molischianum DSM 120]